jgi:hypothetical protein
MHFMENDPVAVFTYICDGTVYQALRPHYEFVSMLRNFERRLPADLDMCPEYEECSYSMALLREAAHKVLECRPVPVALWIGVHPEFMCRYGLDHLDDPLHPWFVAGLHRVFRFYAGVVWGDIELGGQVR